MLNLEILPAEYWDETNERMVYKGKKVTLRLEHSLISISKWESKWCIPFFDTEKTSEQLLDYIKCMTLDVNVPDEVYDRLSLKNIREINKYIEAPMTASTITSTDNKKTLNERTTSELLYYYMIAYNIPVEFEKWHINRLIMLIRICSEKNKPAKKMTKREIMEQNRAINAARKAKLNTKG